VTDNIYSALVYRNRIPLAIDLHHGVSTDGERLDDAEGLRGLIRQLKQVVDALEERRLRQ
jgi:hypothetical protein